MHTDEAGACLCPAFANGGSTDPSRFIDLQLFLNAAHGGSFSFSTQIDRQKVLKPKPTNPAAPVPEPVGMTLKETNVHFIFLQQQMFFANWWALVAANKPLGLVQRCLFSFGARLNVGKQTWNAFSQDIAMPVIERLFAALIRRFGPRMTSVEQAVFHTTGCQRAVLVELEEIGRLFARKDSVSSVLREAMPKAMYWLGTSMMTNHLVQHLWPAALGGPLPDDVPMYVNDACFLASVQFIQKRYLCGQAVLAVSAKEQIWNPRSDSLDSSDLLPLLLRILRGAPGAFITADHIFCADLALKRSLERGGDAGAKLAELKIATIWQHLKDLGIGEICATGVAGYMQKYHIQSLSQRCLTWLRNHRVPLSHFGLRTTVDHDAFLGRFPGHSDINVAFPPRDHPQTPNAAAEEAKTATDVSSEPPTAALPKTKPSRKQSKDQLVWEDVARVDLGTPLLSNQDLLHHLRHRGEWSTCRVSVRIAWQNKQRVQAEVRCLESAACPCCWRAHYILAAAIYQPGTLILQCSGAHSGHEACLAATGKVFNAKQETLAVQFFDKGGRTGKNLRAALLAGGCAESSLPTNTQLSNWLKNMRKRRKPALDCDLHIVEAVQLEVNKLPQSPPKQLDSMFLLEQPLISDSEVCVLFACPGMLEALGRYDGPDVALAVDTKMKVLDRGMGVATLSLLVKDALRPTHLPRGPGGCRTQSRAWTSHGLPIVQAVFHAETKPNYIRLFQKICDLWASRQPRRSPLQEQLTLQIHKDFHPSIEEARLQVLPLSRACDDFFHLKQKSLTTMQAKCKQVIHRKGKYIKKNLGFALDTLEILRLVPTLPLFSWLWKAFLATLGSLGEPELANYLKSYERVLPAQFACQMLPDDIVYVSFWIGFDGIISGSGSGSEPAEALHSSWQRELSQLGGRGNINHGLQVLQQLYTQHWKDWYKWGDSSSLSFAPVSQDPQLINGTALVRAGRTPAAHLNKLPRDTLYILHPCANLSWVAFASAARTSPLNCAVARKVLHVLLHPETLTAHSLPDLFAADGTLSLESLRFHFESIVYLKIKSTSILCSCLAAAMHAQCEHSTFLRSCSLPNFSSPALNLSTVPANKKGGRKKASNLPPRKRRRVSS